MSRSATIPGPLDGEQNYQKQFQELVKKWDESKNDPAHFDATEILTEMADILEKVRSEKFITLKDPKSYFPTKNTKFFI